MVIGKIEREREEEAGRQRGGVGICRTRRRRRSMCGGEEEVQGKEGDPRTRHLPAIVDEEGGVLEKRKVLSVLLCVWEECVLRQVGRGGGRRVYATAGGRPGASASLP